MSNSFFHFKQFSISQDRCAMKVSTDAVVLGALADQANPESILDIGTGTGVIILMLAQRFSDSRVDGVEIDKPAFDQATENIANSPWPNRIKVLHQPFQEFYKTANQTYDLIVSNPPFFKDHIKSLDPQRNLAIHNDGLPFGELIKGVKTLLKPSGLFWVILPPHQMQYLVKIAAFFKLFPAKNVELKDSPGKKTLREITAFSFYNNLILQHELLIKNEANAFSPSYITLLKDFLLNF